MLGNGVREDREDVSDEQSSYNSSQPDESQLPYRVKGLSVTRRDRNTDFPDLELVPYDERNGDLQLKRQQ